MDAEIIWCNWMEPRSQESPGQTKPKALLGSPWWDWSIGYGPFPRRLTLDLLHEVEGKLMEQQWTDYQDRLWVDYNFRRPRRDGLWACFGSRFRRPEDKGHVSRA